MNPTPPLTRDQMRADIAKVLRMDPAEIGGTDDLGDLGLDSLRAMGMLLRWSEAGLDLDFIDLADKLTLDAWWATAERAMNGPAAGG